MLRNFEDWERRERDIETPAQEYTAEEAKRRLEETVRPWLSERGFSEEEVEQLMKMVAPYSNYHVIESLVALAEAGKDPVIIHEALRRFKETVSSDPSLRGKEYLAENRQKGLIAQWFKGDPAINMSSQLKWEKERKGRAA